MRITALTLLVTMSPILYAADLTDQVAAIEDRVIEWRRDFHAHPELGNRETETAKKVARHLKRLGMEVETGIAHTGVVGVLRGDNAGPVIALRADMDGLPVTEEVDVPFASKVTTLYNGQEVGVMHACGHDTHVAMLMGVAELLAAQRKTLSGTVIFVFQPAEEGPPRGEDGGARLMLAEGVFDKLRPEAIYGLHATSSLPTGIIGYRSGPTMAAADTYRITVTGLQTHGSRPWNGVDPIVVSAQIIMGLQTIASRQVDVTKAPSVISVGSVRGGLRHNIIPDQVELWGTVRTFDKSMREDILQRIEHTATSIAQAGGATAKYELEFSVPVTRNDPALTETSLPVLRDVVSNQRLMEVPLVTGAEDFAYFSDVIPGFYYFLGVTPHDQDPTTAPSNHSPRFYVDETALKTGVETMTALALAHLNG